MNPRGRIGEEPLAVLLEADSDVGDGRALEAGGRYSKAWARMGTGRAPASTLLSANDARILAFGSGCGQIATRRLKGCASTRDRKYASCSHSTSAIVRMHSIQPSRPH
jgi:hypothetical protein